MLDCFLVSTRRLTRSTVLAFVLLCAAGCAAKKPVPVSGTVTLDGQPVKEAAVYFYAVGGDHKQSRMAAGITDEHGKFDLSTLGDKDGAFPRQYKVVIQKYVLSVPVPDFPNTVDGRAARREWFYENVESKGIQPYKNSLPEKYAHLNSTTLECNVTGPTTVDFPLTSK